MSEHERHTYYRGKHVSRQRNARRAHFRPLRSPARRRDSEQPQLINSREIRLTDGVDGLPADFDAEHLLYDDMTLNLKSRRERQSRQRRRRRRIIGALVAFCLIALFCGGLFWMQRSNDLARAASQHQGARKLNNGTSSAATDTASTEPTGLPTPVVASFQGVPIHLSVHINDLTEIGFHPASNPYAMVLDTSLTPDSAEAVRAAKSTGRDKSKQPEGAAVPLIGSYIQMWRTDTGSIPGRTSIDEGAPAGAITYAPIDGTITAVREYNYENGCKDFEVHLSFESTALARYEMVMIHEENVQVKVGDKVIGGVTPIAQVRDLTPFLDNQLAQYTGEAGNHAHVQVNDMQAPSYAARMQYREEHGYYIN